MDIKCPYCDTVSGLTGLHRHMVEAHAMLVLTEHDEETGKMRYVIACPLCPLKYQHAIKPRYRDPAFLEEYRTEIAVVAFDQLLYHLAKDHAEAMGIHIEISEDEL